ncbi:glycosyltransferase [Halomonas dongshanensis]|uniref:Glycosyltransferase n=1 Tax=Halomonas dongshanensis TaxID=2890835 RepID=A0ABT2ED89_9GAMM|nr:glycosyltransferase [Halomonas dongshanensis]MCS2609537.1 glycosyltransferase [Halomonas dongshanensis]
MSGRLTLIVAGDPNQRTGGYIYDARVVEALRARGWDITVEGVAGRFPDADATARESLERTLNALPDGSHALLDGLAMSALPDVLASHHTRLILTALIHHPLGDEQGLDEQARQRLHLCEFEALQYVQRIIVTSRFTQRRLDELASHYDRALNAPITAVEPGVERAPLAPTREKRAPEAEEAPLHLLCVATLVPRKGQDILVEALAQLTSLPWRCTCIGAARDRAFAAKVEALIEKHDLHGRIHLAGECDAASLDAAYRNADALVLPSWYEGYGMVITEALAYGLPVVTTTGGALRDTLPTGAGLSVAPGSVDALRDALAQLIDDSALRTRLTDTARQVRATLVDWDETGRRFEAALTAPDETTTREPSLGEASSGEASSGEGGHFTQDWLAMREALDVRSRASALVEQAGAWLDEQRQSEGSALEIVDLGSGRGSNLIYMAPRLPNNQRWTLVDHDAALLDDACLRAEKSGLQSVTVSAHCGSLADIAALPLDSARLVSASALIDLVSRPWCEALADACAARQQALLIALSITVDWYFTDTAGARLTDAEDAAVLGWVKAHQAGDKGLGHALGGEAHGVLAELLRARGYQVEEAATPWRIAAGDAEFAALARTLIKGWAQAARQAAPNEAARVTAWENARLRLLSEGALGVVVEHADLLALPPQRSA